MRRLNPIWLIAVVLAFITTDANAAGRTSFSTPNPAVQNVLRNLRTEVRARRHTFEVGYSSAMDHSIDTLCRLKEPTGWLRNAPQDKLLASGGLQALPSSFDWKTQKGTTPIKNQMACGDCWAFGTVGPLESQIKLQCNVTADLSEQYLTSCNTDGWGCNGGWWAHDYHMNKPGRNDTAAGAVLESASPFKGTDTACGGPYNHPYRITNWAYVAGQPRPSVQAIKQAIYNYGPISAAVYVGPKFQAYSSGIFNANESGQVNHAVVLVGWNDDLGTDNGYWILRNSWGSGWGENGYMRIRYGCNQVGYSANYIQFSCNNPNPNPDPTPNPTPDPTPDPTPNPTPTGKPDLKGNFASLSVYRQGYRVVGNVRIRNIGKTDAGPFNSTLYLSDDGKAKTTYLGKASLSGLAKGASIYVSFNKYSSTMFSGKYLLVIVDSDSQVKEIRENNNRAVKLIP